MISAVGSTIPKGLWVLLYGRLVDCTSSSNKLQ